MKKYVFLVKGIDDISGAPRYVNNKCRWLMEQGWEVFVFWSYDIDKVTLEYVVPFDNKDFIVHELQFYPQWFTKRQRNTVVERIANRIGQADQIVVESNKLQLGAWGELISNRLKAKHIVFVTSEKIKIKRKETFGYCYFKLLRNEFFTINSSAVKYIFSDFIEISDPDKYYWSASPGVEVEEHEFPPFDDLPSADYTICHFGRNKGYFPYMISQLQDFFTQYSNLRFNVFFLGDLTNASEVGRQLSFPNVHVAFHPAVQVVPLQVFTRSDVIVATAGCAALASRKGGKVVSMDVNNNVPLGLLRYTTLDYNTNSGDNNDNLSLSDWLRILLIEKKVFQPIENNKTPHSFDYQMQYVTLPDGNYYDTTLVNEMLTKNDRLWGCLIKVGLFRLVEHFYFAKRRR